MKRPASRRNSRDIFTHWVLLVRNRASRFIPTVFCWNRKGKAHLTGFYRELLGLLEHPRNTRRAAGIDCGYLGNSKHQILVKCYDNCEESLLILMGEVLDQTVDQLCKLGYDPKTINKRKIPEWPVSESLQIHTLK